MSLSVCNCYQFIHEAQLSGLELLDSILSLHMDFRKYSGGVEKILDAVRHILAVQKELGLNYCTGQSSVILSLFSILTQLELEHEQYSVLNLALFLLRWKGENGIVLLPLFSCGCFCIQWLWLEKTHTIDL